MEKRDPEILNQLELGERERELQYCLLYFISVRPYMQSISYMMLVYLESPYCYNSLAIKSDMCDTFGVGD